MSKRAADSTAHLLQLCAGYFGTYVMTGVLVKYFTLYRDPRISDLAYLVNNTLGGALVALGVCVAMGWFRFSSNRLVRLGGLQFPSEFFYILPSGLCTAVVIPTTTLMYTLPISVMVAMVIMRGSVIVISRAVDALQIRQGLLHRRVYAEENWAVGFALLAVGTNIFWTPHFRNQLADLLTGIGAAMPGLRTHVEPGKGGFEFLQNPMALWIMGSYIVAYSFRIYIMNYYKNTRPPGGDRNNESFFATEQVFASLGMLVLAWIAFQIPDWLQLQDARFETYRFAIMHLQLPAVLSGIPFGLVALFSVFLFMFQGRTATFAGLVNRLTSLLAGTTATLILAWWFHARMPAAQDWVSMGFILVAVTFLARAEKRRAVEVLRAAA